MKIVVGLGNPGREYEGTPHNVGFAVIDELADRWSCGIRRSFRFKARIGKSKREDDTLLLLKPETYMNNSGTAVAAVMRYWKVGPESVALVLDDADLPLGTIRVRPKGRSGGHRGLDSVIHATGSDAIVRVRIGIGRGPHRRDLIDHVLSPFTKQEHEVVGREVARAADAIECILDAGVETAMNRFNARA